MVTVDIYVIELPLMVAIISFKLAGNFSPKFSERIRQEISPWKWDHRDDCPLKVMEKQNKLNEDSSFSMRFISEIR